MRSAPLIFVCAMPVMAQDISLGVPLDCVLGETCYIQNYVDHDAGPNASDFQCGNLTYDTHTGTDFALVSLAQMRQGVDVVAAASGTVRNLRNTMPDILYTEDNADIIAGRECGNGVVITHANGWETQYCHLAQGSVSVSVGMNVSQGDVLGQVGLSGRTQFPHVHVSVRQGGIPVDPFSPDGETSCVQSAQDTLWSDPLDTPAGGLVSFGFATSIPEYSAVKAGDAAASMLRPNQPIVLWALAFGGQDGDVLSFEIIGPEGSVLNIEETLTKSQALVMRARGLNAPPTDWDKGQYTGTITLVRDGIALDTRTTAIGLR